jgi:predicted Mrr-cat superfamily restriction endonuclease
MIDEGVVAVGGHELGDLSHRPTLEDLRIELRERFPERNERAIGIFVGYWRAFLYDMTVGDVVALSLTDRRVAVGWLVGGYRYRPDEPDQVRHARSVDWLLKAATS